MISQVTRTGGLFIGPARWGLMLLVFGLAIAYPVLSSRIISNQRSSLIQSSLATQTLAAHAVRNSIRVVGFSRDEIDSQLTEATQLIQARSGSGDLGFAIVALDGTIMSQSPRFPIPDEGSLNSYKILAQPDRNELQFPTALAGELNSTGELLLPSGANPGILVATDYSPTDTWQIVALTPLTRINHELQQTRLFVLISFLSLALLLAVLIIAFYLSLATGLSSAINSAVALEEATVRFQEHVGEFKRPLHNIQGLADMLAITEDPDERNGYLREIKGEVGRIIKDLESTDP